MDAETKQALQVALPKAAAWVRGAVRRDRANAYGLLAAWTLPRLGGELRGLGLMPPDYCDDGWIIADGVIVELPFPASRANCDGCTLAPDFWPQSWGGLKAYVAALFHDRWYKWLEKFSRAWGWAVKKVRKLGDIIFGNILRSLARLLRGVERLKAEIGCRVYYSGVRAFGAVAHTAYRRFASVAVGAAGALALSGCAVPMAWDDPDAVVVIPAHCYTNLVTGETWCVGNEVAGEGGDEGAGEAGNEVADCVGNEVAAEGGDEGAQ